MILNPSNRSLSWPCVVMLALSLPRASAQVAEAGTERAPVELGAVAWERDFDRALARAEAEGKPLFALFQEVPGCATCVSFGRAVLSHPLLVEAAEELFVPVAVLNNRPGADREVLERYEEPAWNNPVVRFLDADGRDLVRRKDRVWTPAGIAERMIAALEAARRDVPGYLELAARELSDGPVEKAVFAMPCFWSGQAKLSSLDGVVDTRAGWLDGREVVEVTFLARELSFAKLVHRAGALDCTQRVYATSEAQLRAAERSFRGAVARAPGEVRDARESDREYYLRRTRWNHLPLTRLQRVLVNSDLYHRRDPAGRCSPHQLELLERLQDLDASAARALEGREPPESAYALAAYARDLAALLGVR